MTEAQQIAEWLRREAEALYQEARGMLIWCDSDSDLQDILNARGSALQKASMAIERGEWKEQDNG